MYFRNYTVRLISEHDAEALFSLIDRNRPRLDFFAGTLSKTTTPGDTRLFIQDMMQRKESRAYFPFFVTRNEDGAAVGFIDVKNIDWHIPKAELGCFIDEEYAGKGVSFNALSAVVDHCFAEQGINKLFLHTHPDNTAARRLAEKCGFEVEGIIRKDYRTARGNIVDLVYYGRLNSTWRTPENPPG